VASIPAIDTMNPRANHRTSGLITESIRAFLQTVLPSAGAARIALGSADRGCALAGKRTREVLTFGEFTGSILPVRELLDDTRLGGSAQPHWR